MPSDWNDRADPPQPQDAPSEFTQMFGSMQPPATHDTLPASQPPVSPRSDAKEQGFTAIFAPREDVGGNAPTAPPQAPAFSEAPTQIFAVVPQPAKSAANEAASAVPGNLKRAATMQGAPPAPSAPGSGAPKAAHAASEFTSVFQPIAPPPPRPAPPAAPIAAPAPAGEFTQFFSAISAGDSVVEQPAAPQPVAARVSPAQPSSQQASPQSQAGEFTQLFRSAAPAAPASLPGPVASNAQEQAGAFTQMFSPPAQQMPTHPVANAEPLQPAFSADQPIFGTPAQRGSFTDVFAAQPLPTAPLQNGNNGPARHSPYPDQPIFQENFAPPSSPRSSAFGAPAPTTPQAAGEFTQLLQSLERPGKPPAPVATAMPVDAAFFAEPAGRSTGESEYTRVMRGGGAASPAGSLSAAPAAGSFAAPGLAIAPAPKEEAKETKAVKDKLTTPVILLIVMNVILLVALIIAGLVFLRHR